MVYNARIIKIHSKGLPAIEALTFIVDPHHPQPSAQSSTQYSATKSAPHWQRLSPVPAAYTDTAKIIGFQH